MKKIVFHLAFLLAPFLLFAQDTVVQTETAGTGLRSNEKIYVVAAVLGTILAGLFVYVIRLDKKISRLEKSAADQ